MSDDGVMNVEDDGPEVPPVEPPAEPPVAEVPPVEAPPDPDAPPPTVEVDGQVMVPLAALKSERQQRQAAEKELNRVKPYAEFIEKNPNLVRPPAPPAPTTFGAPPPDPELEHVAKMLDLYTPEGKPDVARAAGLAAVFDRRAVRQVQQQIAPMREESDQTKSARNFQTMMSYKGPNGVSPSPESLAAVWQSMPASQSADPQVASVLALTAIGMDVVQGKVGAPKAAPAAPQSAPLVTEGAGGPARRPTLSALEASIARDRGITESKWAEHTKGFQPGRPNQLED